jgi:putative endonuclease
MAENHQLGTNGEDIAAQWLVQHGYQLLHRNWRHKQYEIDIIATKDGQLHFFEIKTRHRTKAGHPEDSVTKKKFRNLQRAADEFLSRHAEYRWIRFNVLAITIEKDGAMEFFLLEDVFF